MATSDKVVIYQNDTYSDERGDIATIYPPKDGSFKRLFCETKFSLSENNVLRGFHGDFVTGKLITCLSGSCILVYMSLNENDENYLKPQNIRLSYSGHLSKVVFIPKGYINAHYCLSDECLFFYQLTSPYNLDNQISIRWDSIGYDWGNIKPILSDRDKNSETLQQYLERTHGKKTS